MKKSQLVTNDIKLITPENWSSTSNGEITRHDLISDLGDSAKQFIRNKHAQTTQDAYQSDIRIFIEWCKLKGIHPKHATSSQICNFLADQAEGSLSRWVWINKSDLYGELTSGRPVALSTLQRRLVSIKFALSQFGRIFNEIEKKIFNDLLQGIASQIGGEKRKVNGITKENLIKIFSSMDLKDHVDLRDRALLMMLYAGAYRRSELSNMLLHNVTMIKGHGLQIKHDKVKGKLLGITKVISKGSADLCPVKFLIQYLEVTDIRDGYVFRRSNRSRKMLNETLSGHSISKIVKKRCEDIGLEGLYRGHSGRRGFVDAALRAGKPLNKIMEQTGHSSLQTLKEYFDETRKWEDNASDGLY